ncbi:MAG TPA: nicotinate-nucleotide diphosphorylase (carboxylating), partial [Candidatus Paceibacterota bacterium]|nr:nicotinate-nucleotide diphosphorylase (carboxylating) [Candidatus Paceibacterota bacterium]
MTPVLPAGLEPVVRAALAEDVGAGDVTTLAIIPTDRSASARLVARDPLVVAGLEIARLAFLQLDPAVQFQPACADGDKAAAGQALARIDGPARALLTGERVALNFLQRLSGIATLTAQFVAAVAGTRAQILDTRKTTPGWRALEKYAVRC